MGSITPEDLQRATQRLAAGRVRASDHMPYLTKSLRAMIPFARQDFGTFAVDKRWRMYYDPQLCLDWSIEELAAAWLHECSHLIRHHSERFERVAGGDFSTAEQWNHAADGTINSDLQEVGVFLQDPENRFYAKKNSLYPQWREGMTTEQMYEIARKGAGAGKQGDADKQKTETTQNEEEPPEEKPYEDITPEGEASDDPTDEDSDDPKPGNSDEDSEEETTSPDEDSKGDESSSSDSEEQENSEGYEDSDDSTDVDTDETTAESDADHSPNNEADEGNGDSADKDDGQDASEDSTPGEGDSEGEGEGEPSEDSDSETPSETGCGSGASGGAPKDYEEQDIDDGSLDPFDIEQVREETARDIQEAASQWGTVPGGLIRSADEILNPQIDWQRQLSRWMRKTVAQVVGQADYSFSRRSRASLSTPFYLPGLRDNDPPVVKVVLDTSGSMQPADLARGLSEVCSILDQTQRNSGVGIDLINCDAGAHTVDRIRDVSQITIRGGGGTDMRIGMQKAAEARPAADVILIVTDGGTPWMKMPPKENPRAVYVVLLIEQAKGLPLASVMERIPKWMHVIPTYR